MYQVVKGGNIWQNNLSADTIPSSRDQKVPVIYPKCICAATVQNSLLFNEIAFLQETAPVVILLACIFSTSDDAHLIEANISYKCLASQNEFQQNSYFQKLYSSLILLITYARIGLLFFLTLTHSLNCPGMMPQGFVIKARQWMSFQKDIIQLIMFIINIKRFGLKMNKFPKSRDVCLDERNQFIFCLFSQLKR